MEEKTLEEKIKKCCENSLKFDREKTIGNIEFNYCELLITKEDEKRCPYLNPKRSCIETSDGADWNEKYRYLCTKKAKQNCNDANTTKME